MSVLHDLAISIGPRTTHASPRHLQLLAEHAPGGALSEDQIDATIGHAAYDSIVIGGLHQKTFEHFIARHGGKFTTVYFWKCPHIADLSPIEQLPAIEQVGFYWNQRASRWWDFRKTPRIIGLCLLDFTKISTLEGIPTSLRELEFGNVVWVKSRLPTLEPIGRCRHLTSLRLSIKRVEDGRIAPLGNCVHLHDVQFPTNLFSLDQLAWLKSKLPASVQSRVLQPTITLNHAASRAGKQLNTLLVGKPSRTVDAVREQAKVAQHVDLFERRVAHYRDHPQALPAEESRRRP